MSGTFKVIKLTIAKQAIRKYLKIFVLFCCYLPLTLWASSGQHIDAVRLWDSPQHTRVVFDLSSKIEYKAFVLSDPERFVLDIPNAKLSSKFSGIKSQKGRVKNIRSGQPSKDILRLVFDLTTTIKPKTFLMSPAAGKPHRLVIDLFDTDVNAKNEQKVIRSVNQNLVDPQRKVLIAIDAGHGGEDPGAVGSQGSYEKNVTLSIARQLKKVIDQEPGMSALLIRNGDYFIPLKNRYEKARDAKADLFVSIHADAVKNRTAAGSSVYMLSTRGASSEAARWLANQENASDLVGGVSLDDKDGTLAAVLLDLSQGATLSASETLAYHVLSGLSKIGRMHKQEVQRANFVVLRSPDVPSILVETAFISNPQEEKRLLDVKHQQRLANAVVDGVREYFYRAPPPGTWLAAHPGIMREHVVSRGETLSSIAEQHGISVTHLRKENNLRNDIVYTGSVLRIPSF